MGDELPPYNESVNAREAGAASMEIDEQGGRGVMCLASVPAQSQGCTRERGALGVGLSSGEALALAVGVVSVRHRATVSSSGASHCVRGGHTV